MGLNFDMWRGAWRPTPLAVLHMIIAVLDVTITILFFALYTWLWFTKWNSIDATAWLLLANALPAIAFWMTALPFRQLPSIPDLITLSLTSIFAMGAAIMFLVLFGDPAWATRNVYTNALTDLQVENARWWMLTLWWLGLIFGIFAQIIKFIFVQSYWITYVLTLATPVGLSMRAQSSFLQLFKALPISKVAGL